MRRQSIENLLPRAGGSVYKLVRMAANRALEISEGKPALVKAGTDKPTTIALEEILQGKVESKEVADARVSDGKKSKSDQ